MNALLCVGVYDWFVVKEEGGRSVGLGLLWQRGDPESTRASLKRLDNSIGDFMSKLKLQSAKLINWADSVSENSLRNVIVR